MSERPPEKRALPEANLRYLRKEFSLRGLLQADPPRTKYLRIVHRTCETLREAYEYTPTDLEVRKWVSALIVDEDHLVRHIEAIDEAILGDRVKLEELATAAAGTIIQVWLESQTAPSAALC